MQDKDEKDRKKIEIRLFQPPEGEEPTTGPWSHQAQMESFHAVKAALMR